MERSIIFLLSLICVVIVVASERMNRQRLPMAVQVLDDSETLKYIQERRLMGLEELERLERLESMTSERMSLQLLQQEQSEFQLLRRLQQEDDSEEILFDEDEVVEHEEPELEAMSAKRKEARKAQQLLEDEYTPEMDGMYGNGYNQNYGQFNGNSNYGNNGYNNNNYNNNNPNNNGGGRYPNNNGGGWGNNNNGGGGWGNNNGNTRQPICCQECPRGDISCLSNCERVCHKSQTCNKAGEGAYSSFCMQACPNTAMSGFASGDQYLPIKACEGECSAQVQELCSAHSCRDYGCVARNCQEKAPLMCRMT